MEEDAEPAAPRSDEELIAAVRAGDPGAFGTLYTRHLDAARRLARSLTPAPSDVDDLVAEAFAKLLSTLREGGGPDVAFRAYLLTTVRNLFYDRARRDRRVKVTDDLSAHDPGEPFEDPAVEGLERSLVARAFAQLDERWQTVLWHTEVEGEKPATVATRLGLEPNAVSALAYRAREGLRQNYLREHISASTPPDSCQATVDRLGAHVRGGLSRRARRAVDDHLSGCDRCQRLCLELWDVNAGLKGVLAPAVLGPTAAAAYAGASTAGTGPWPGIRRIVRRRSVQAAAVVGVLTVAVAAMAFALTGNPGPDPAEEAIAAPPGSQPPAAATEPAPAKSPTPAATMEPTVAPTSGPAVEPDGGEPQRPAERASPDEPAQPGDTQPADDQPPLAEEAPSEAPDPPLGEDPSDAPDEEEPPADDEPDDDDCLELDLSVIGLRICLGLG